MVCAVAGGAAGWTILPLVVSSECGLGRKRRWKGGKAGGAGVCVLVMMMMTILVYSPCVCWAGFGG